MRDFFGLDGNLFAILVNVYCMGLVSGCIALSPKAQDKSQLEECVTDQVKLFWDVCAESTSGYETMSGTDAYFEGVKCAVNAIKTCQEGI